MALPFTIKYSKSFDRKLTEDEITTSLSYIRGIIFDKYADHIQIVNHGVNYKGSVSAFNWNIFRPVDRGEFKILEKGGKSVITYEIFMYHLLIFVSIAAIIFFLLSKSYWALFLCFGWLGGVNWIMAAVRHNGMLDGIKEGIDTLLATPEHVEDNEIIHTN